MGSYYSYGHLNGTLIRNIPYNIVNKWNNTHIKAWINYEGYILLERCNITDSFTRQHEVYAVKEQYIHIYTKEPLVIRNDMILKKGNQIKYMKSNYTGTFDLTLRVTYSQPIAYIPLDNESFFYVSTINYSGHLKASAYGYTFDNKLNTTVSINKSINQDISGGGRVMANMDIENNTTIKRAALLECLPVEFLSSLPQLVLEPESYIYYRFKVLIYLTNTGTLKDNFYENITLEPYWISLDPYPSQNATKDDIEKIRTEAPQIYGPAEAEMGLTDYLIMAISIVIAVIVILIVVLLITKKKGQSGTT